MFACCGTAQRDRGAQEPTIEDEAPQSSNVDDFLPAKAEAYIDVSKGIIHPSRMMKRLMIPADGRRLFDLETELENCDKDLADKNKERLKLQERLQALNEELSSQDAKRDELVEAITAEVNAASAKLSNQGEGDEDADHSGVGTLGRPAEEEELATFASAHSMGRCVHNWMGCVSEENQLI